MATYSFTLSDLQALQQDESPADTGRCLFASLPPARTSSSIVDEALGDLPRRLLSLGIAFQAKFGRGVTVLRRTFARMLGVTEVDVKLALSRLRAAGLERWDGMVVQLVPFTDRKAKTTAYRPWEVPVREFAPGVDWSADMVVPVSDAAVSWAERVVAAMKRGWGGARRGAGRPRKESTVLISAESEKGEVRAEEAPSGLTAAAAQTSEISTPVTPPAPQADFGFVPPPEPPDPDRRHRLRELGKRYLPPDITEKSIPLVRTPPPPMLSAGLSDVDKVKALAAAYRGAVDARFPQLGRCFVMLRGDIEKHKFFPTMLAAAAFMEEHQISPAAWCLFSVDVWKQWQITSGPPTLAFVFSHARLTDRLAWFEDEKDAYMGNTVLYSEEAKALAIRHKAMWDVLMRENPRDRPSLCAIVDRYFPGDTYETMLERAKNGQLQLQRELDAAVKKGVIVW